MTSEVGALWRGEEGGGIWKNPAEAIDGEAGSRKKKNSPLVPVWFPVWFPFGSRWCNPSISVDMTPEISRQKQSAPVVLPLNYKYVQSCRMYVLS